MSDVVMVAVTTTFFALCLAYVRWCDHIIGPDPVEPGTEPADASAGAADHDRTDVSA
jgi:hypothetical protein